MASMESRLQEAAMEGSVATLLELLQQDPFLLDMVILKGPSPTPLHVAAPLGHVEFVNEILHRKPELVKELDSQRSSPLHLAAREGHLEIVKLLLRVDTDLCSLLNADGMNPLHLAAMNGRIDALRELIEARPDAARTVVDQSKTILHLCIKNNQLDALKMVVQAIDDVNFLNAKDDDGFTILHLAVYNKQIQTVKFLVSIEGMEVNAVNSNGFTALDVLAQSQRDVEYFEIEESLRVATASQTTSVITPASENENQITRAVDSRALPPPNSNDQGGSGLNGCTNGHGHWLMRKRDALMIVASVIATMTFEAALKPPSGIGQDARKSTHSVCSSCFIISITVSFVSSIIELCLLTYDFSFTNPFFLRFLSIPKILSIVGLIVAYAVSISCLI